MICKVSKCSTWVYKMEHNGSSSESIDLNVFVVPGDLHHEQYRSTYFEDVMNRSLLVGFIRVPSGACLLQMRDAIQHLGIVPQSYVFLRCVGRCLAQVQQIQEVQMKALHFAPPHAYAPELFILPRGVGSSSVVVQHNLEEKSRSENGHFPGPVCEFDADGSKCKELEATCSRGVTSPFMAVEVSAADESRPRDSPIRPPESTCKSACYMPRDDGSIDCVSTSGSGCGKGSGVAENPMRNDAPGLRFIPGTPLESRARSSAPVSQLRSEYGGGNVADGDSFCKSSILGAAHDERNGGLRRAAHCSPNDGHSPVGNSASHDAMQEDTSLVESRSEFDLLDEHEKKAAQEKFAACHICEKEPLKDDLQSEHVRDSRVDDVGDFAGCQTGGDAALTQGRLAKDLDESRFKEGSHSPTDGASVGVREPRTEERDHDRPTDYLNRDSRQGLESVFEDDSVMKKLKEIEQMKLRNSELRRKAMLEGMEKASKMQNVSEEKKAKAEELKIQLERIKAERNSLMRSRESLIKQVRNLTAEVQKKSSQNNGIWRRKFFQEKKRTEKLTEDLARSKKDIDFVYHKLLSGGSESQSTSVLREGDRAVCKEKPSDSLNQKRVVALLQQECDDLKGKIEKATHKLSVETKTREACQQELKELRERKHACLGMSSRMKLGNKVASDV